MWLGPAERNTETLICTSKGVVRAHTVERLTPSTKWDINYILDMRGAPQRPDPSKPGLHIPVRIRMEPDVNIQMSATRPARKEEGPRSAYLSKDDFKKYGFTEGCEGCSRKAAGMAPRPHSRECRGRFETEMWKTPEGRKRLEYADMKVHAYLKKKLLANHGEVDEKERPGITGNDVEAAENMTDTGVPAAAEGQTDTRPESHTTEQEDKQAGKKASKSHKKSGSTERSRVANKRPAEDEADDSSRGDRVDWGNSWRLARLVRLQSHSSRTQTQDQQVQLAIWERQCHFRRCRYSASSWSGNEETARRSRFNGL